MQAILAILARVPLLGWLLAAAIAVAGVQTLRLSAAEDELAASQAEAQARFARQQAAYATAAAEAASAALAETDRRIKAQEGAIHEAESQAARARADAAAASDSASRLRQRFAAAAAARCSGRAADPAPAAASAPAADTGPLLAYVQRRLDDAAGVFAQVADERGIAAELCARQYDALTR